MSIMWVDKRREEEKTIAKQIRVRLNALEKTSIASGLLDARLEETKELTIEGEQWQASEKYAN